MNIAEQYRRKVLYVFSFVGIASTLTFGVAFYLSQGMYSYALFEVFLVALVIINVIYYRKTQNYAVASNVILLLTLVILLFLITTGGYKGTGILWTYTYPLLTFFLKDRKEALIWNLALGLGVGSLLLLEFSHEQVDIYYEPGEIRHAAGAYAAVFLLAFFYNRILEDAMDSLREKSIVDYLTGLYNRGFFMESLNKLVERLSRDPSSQHCVIYIDLDRFKSVNDTYGHEVGDKVLKKVAYMLQRGFREGDIVSRMGGDEFIVLAYDCTGEDIRKKLKNLVSEIESEFIRYNLSASYGVVDIPGDSLNVKDILRLADERMYQMKAKKRE